MVSDHGSQIRDIRDKLNELCTRDPQRRNFGANHHNYRLSPVLTEKQIGRLEHEFGVTFPSGYRQFLLQLGNGGAGPYYGIFSLDGTDPEDLTCFESIASPFPWKDKLLRPRRNLPGVVYISNYGCALRFFLVVTGHCRGEVWHDWRADSKGIYPALDVKGRRLQFLDWYIQWLDESLAATRRNQATGS